MNRTARISLSIAALLFAGTAAAQAGFPTRTVTLTVGFAPGENQNVDRAVLVRRYIE